MARNFFGFGWLYGFFGGGEGGGANDAAYSFAGVPGSGITSPNGTGTVTETITDHGHTETLVFTAEASNASLYQLTSVSGDGNTHSITPNANSPTYSFGYSGSPVFTSAAPLVAAVASPTITETITNAYFTDTKTFVTGSGGSFTQSTDTVTYSSSPTGKTTTVNNTTITAKDYVTTYAFDANGQQSVILNNGTSTITSMKAPLDPTATFTGLSTNVGSTQNTITETINTGDAIVTKTYVGSQTAGYTLSQTTSQYIPGSSSGASLDLHEFDRANFNFANNTVTWVRPDGTTHSQSLTANADQSYVDLGSLGTSGDFVGETITHGSQSYFEIFYSSKGTGGEYMEVAHGSGTAASQNLNGLIGQLATSNSLHPFTT